MGSYCIYSTPIFQDLLKIIHHLASEFYTTRGELFDGSRLFRKERREKKGRSGNGKARAKTGEVVDGSYTRSEDPKSQSGSDGMEDDFPSDYDDAPPKPLFLPEPTPTSDVELDEDDDISCYNPSSDSEDNEDGGRSGKQGGGNSRREEDEEVDEDEDIDSDRDESSTESNAEEATHYYSQGSPSKKQSKKPIPGGQRHEGKHKDMYRAMDGSALMALGE